MYALKQALLIKHYIHDVDVTIYHMDIRAFGKGYEEFYRRVLAEGVNVEKGKVAKITETDNHDLIVRVETLHDGGRVAEERYDMVVLSQGLKPGWSGKHVLDIERADDGFFRSVSPKIQPTLATRPGVFIAGVAAGPKDIPDAIVEAGAAAMEASVYLERTGHKRSAGTVAGGVS